MHAYSRPDAVTCTSSLRAHTLVAHELSEVRLKLGIPHRECNLKLLVYAALSYSSSVCGLKLLVYAASRNGTLLTH